MREGFGNVVIEWMASQGVTIGDAWAPPKVLAQGEYGFLYEGGSAASVAAAIPSSFHRTDAHRQAERICRAFADARAARGYAPFESFLSPQHPDRWGAGQ